LSSWVEARCAVKLYVLCGAALRKHHTSRSDDLEVNMSDWRYS
jgi:hypothetical protein